VNAVRPATPGSIAAPHGPSPEETAGGAEIAEKKNFSAFSAISAVPSFLISRNRCGLSSLHTTWATFGSAAISSGRRVA